MSPRRVLLPCLLLLLAGCTGQPGSAPDLPASSSAPPSATPSAGTAPSTAASTSSYAGPQPIPAVDGGPMLWPISTTTILGDGDDRTEAVRYGFVDVAGTLVIRPRYERYEYCRDADGRARYLIGIAAARRAELRDLTGRLIRRAPTTDASCGPAGQVIFTRWIDPEGGPWQDGVLDIATGRVLLASVPGRHVKVLDGRTVDVTEKSGSYFLDPRTGRRAPHPGAVSDHRLEDGAPGVPATARGDGRGAVGLLDLKGRWILAPTFRGAESFTSGYAVVQLAGKRFTFLDTGLHQVGGEWASIDPVHDGSGRRVAYVVTSASGQALLATDLSPLVALGPAQIKCSWPDGGACSVRSPSGELSLIVPPDRTVQALPAGYSLTTGPTLVADLVGEEEDDRASRHLLVIGSGVVVALDWPSRCEALGAAWVVCYPSLPDPEEPSAQERGDEESQEDSEENQSGESEEDQWKQDALPAVVYDAEGNRTPFASVEPLADPTGSGQADYYLASTGRYVGIVDAQGTWLYRQGRFGELED